MDAEEIGGISPATQVWCSRMTASHKQRNLRPHAKLLIADGKRALLGSMNIDRSAFDLRRELGVTVTDKPALRRLSEVFEVDWREAHRYEAPDPILAHAHVEEGFPHDPAMMHD
jgi:cardiolipin synthase A/B